MRNFLPVLLFVIGIKVSKASIQKSSLSINEFGTRFKEDIYTDESGRYEIIKVPHHRNVSGLQIFLDYQKKNIIYKIEHVKSCLITKLDEDVEAPQELVSAVEKSKHKFPYHKYQMFVDSLFPKENVDLGSAIGKTALKFCGRKYEIRHADIYNGDDYNKFAIDSLKKQQSNRKRDVVLRNFYACTPAMAELQMAEMNMCGGNLDDLKAKCKFSTDSCVYRIKCPFKANKDGWVCTGIHKFHNRVCCEYECQPLANMRLDVTKYNRFARDKPAAKREFQRCGERRSGLSAVCEWRVETGVTTRPTGYLTKVKKSCPYVSGKLLCDGTAKNVQNVYDCKYTCKL